MYVCLHAPGNLPLLLECAAAFSPRVEETSADTVVFDARGLELLYGPAEKLAQAIERRIGIPAGIAIAANPDAAMHAARGFPGVTVIPRGREAEKLASLSLHLLQCPAEIAELLHLWGIRTFGQFAKLPPLGVSARLGEEGIDLQYMAAGAGSRQLRAMEEPLRFAEEMELEYPVELLEPLSFVMARLLGEVCGRLHARALAANEIRLRLTLENAPAHETRLKLPVPMLDQKAFLKMLQLELNGRPPVAPVLKVRIEAEPVKPRRTQQGLFLPATPEPQKLEVTVARVRHLVGAGRVGTPELRDTHRPDSFTVRQFAPGLAIPNRDREGVSMRPSVGRILKDESRNEASGADPRPAQGSQPRLQVQAEVGPHTVTFDGAVLCLRRFRPPRLVQVLMVNHQPVRLFGPNISGRVVMARGPWRTSGEWWRDDAWNHDEWDVALESGSLYRLFHEVDSGRWFMEGTYD